MKISALCPVCLSRNSFHCLNILHRPRSLLYSLFVIALNAYHIIKTHVLNKSHALNENGRILYMRIVKVLKIALFSDSQRSFPLAI